MIDLPNSPEWLVKKIAEDSECWLWTGYRSRGYGITARSSLTPYRPVHRNVYHFEVGPIPVGYAVDHLCRNRACVRPSHLQAVTFATNNERKDVSLGIGRYKTHCRNGHAFTSDNTMTVHNGKQITRRCRTCRRETVQKNNARRRA